MSLLVVLGSYIYIIMYETVLMMFSFISLVSCFLRHYLKHASYIFDKLPLIAIPNLSTICGNTLFNIYFTLCHLFCFFSITYQNCIYFPHYLSCEFVKSQKINLILQSVFDMIFMKERERERERRQLCACVLMQIQYF